MYTSSAEWILFLRVCECGGKQQNANYVSVYANAAECSEMKFTSVNAKNKEVHWMRSSVLSPATGTITTSAYLHWILGEFCSSSKSLNNETQIQISIKIMNNINGVKIQLHIIRCKRTPTVHFHCEAFIDHSCTGVRIEYIDHLYRIFVFEYTKIHLYDNDYLFILFYFLYGVH